MQAGYLFIRKKHECIRNVLYLDPGDYPGKIFTCCTLDICALYCLYSSIKTSFLKRHNGWGYSNYDARHQFRDPRNPVNPKKEKYEGNNITVLPQKLPKTKAKITSLK